MKTVTVTTHKKYLCDECGRQMHGYHGDWSTMKIYKNPPLYKDASGNHTLWRMICPYGHTDYRKVKP